MARQANEVGQATLARLGAQGERLHNTEKNLDLASNQNKIAQDRAAELKTLNRSMFAVHVGNPFTSKQRQQKADEEIMNRHRAEREQRENTRREGYAANQRMESNFRELNRIGPQRGKTGKKDYGKFNLDDEDDEARQLEDQIDDGLDDLSGQVHMMNMVGKAIGKEVDTQNAQIGRIMDKVRQIPQKLLATCLHTDNLITERSCGRPDEDEPGASCSHPLRRRRIERAVGEETQWTLQQVLAAGIYHMFGVGVVMPLPTGRTILVPIPPWDRNHVCILL
jgi:hypothetical protein